mgnify:CR=1 FL=1
MPTGIGNGIAGDVFTYFLGDGSGGGGGIPVCPSQYSLLFNGVTQFSFGSTFDVAASSSSLSVWINTSDRNGVAGTGQAIYASSASGLNPFSTYFDAEGVLNSKLGPMTFPAHPELVTNGSFTEVPVGTELIANPTFSDAASITPWAIASTAPTPRATKSWEARFMRLTYDLANGSALLDQLSQPLNTMYSVKMRVRGVTSGGTDQGSAFSNIGDNVALTSANIISNPTLTYDYQDYEFRVWSTDIYFRLYLASAAIGDVVDFDSISVKPVTMLVDNGNFTDGVEKVVDGDFLSAGNWNVNTNWNINTALGVAEADGTSDQDINQNVWLPVIGKSYKVTFEVVSISQGEVLFKLGGVSGQAHTTIGIKTEYIVATSIDRLKVDSQSLFIGSVKDVSVEELGGDWTATNTGSGSISFVENGLRIFTGAAPNAAYCYQSMMDIGKSYKFTYTVSANSSAVGSGVYLYNNNGGGSQVAFADLPQTVGTHTVYFVALDTLLFFNRYQDNADITLTDVSVEELGEGWAEVEPTTTFGANGLTITSTEATDVRIFQVNVISDNKSYKVSYTIHENGLTGTNAIQYYTGSALNGYDDLPNQSVGTHTFYYTAPSVANDRWYFRLDLRGGSTSTTDFVTISNISVEEVLSENEWHHLSLSIDRDSEWKWYVDGVLTNTMDNATDVAPTFGGFVGFTIPDGTIIGGSDWFYGYMTEPSLWNIPLSASEVKGIYDNMYGGQRCLGSLPFTSDLITNGNFTQIGTDRVLNGDFSAGVEKLTQPIDLTVDFSGNSGGVIDDSNSFTTSGGTLDGIRNRIGTFDLVDGKSYKLVIAGTTTSSGFTIGNINLGNEYGTGFGTHYFVATGTYPTTLWIRQQTAGTTDLTTFTIEELGEDWTMDSGWSIGNNRAIVSPTGPTIYLNQNFTTVNGQYYKIEYEILSSSLVGGTNFALSSLSAFGFLNISTAVGTHTYYREVIDDAVTDALKVFSSSTSGSLEITNISAKQVGQGWTVVNSDATHYVEFPGVGARYVSDLTSPELRLAQTGIITPYKSYTVTCHVAYAAGSGALKCQVGNANSAPFIEGFNTVTLTATTGLNFYLIRDAIDVDCVITNVTLTQVGGGNLERWWRMNGTDDSSYIVGNQAPNGTVNNLTFSNTPLIEREVP